MTCFGALRSYGKRNAPSTPMNSIMQQEYKRLYELERKGLEVQTHKKKKIPIVHTRASLGHRHVELVTLPPSILSIFFPVAKCKSEHKGRIRWVEG
jgi:hypothetical protein